MSGRPTRERRLHQKLGDKAAITGVSQVDEEVSGVV
jgi:hypothetical protein